MSSITKKLTGRHIDYDEAKLIFKKNNDLYHDFQDLNRDIKKLVQRSPALEKKIAAKYKTIAKHEAELKKLITKYNGGKGTLPMIAVIYQSSHISGLEMKQFKTKKEADAFIEDEDGEIAQEGDCQEYYLVEGAKTLKKGRVDKT